MENKRSKVYDIHRKSDFVNDVLEKTPSWIIKWGNSFFLFFIFLLLCLSAFISYPDAINAKTIITLDPPPIAVIANNSGEIDNIFISNKSKVSKEEIIIKMYSIAKLKDVLLLKDSILNLQAKADIALYIGYEMPKKLNLGELAEPFNSLVKEFKDFKFFLKQDIVFIRVNSLYREIRRIKELNMSLDKQEDLFEKQYILTKKNFDRFSVLNKKGVISDSEKEVLEAEYLLQSRQYENFSTAQINNEVQIEKIRTQISNLTSDRKQELSIWKNRIDEKIISLLTAVERWEDKFLYRSPFSGKLSIEKNIVNRYYIKENETLFNVIPEVSSKMIAISEMPVSNSGKIKNGTIAQIRLDAYPYQEYGILEGVVKEVSLIPTVTDSGDYITLLELGLPKTLITSHGKEIPFTPNMTGTALILKNNQTLLERIFNRLSTLFSE